MIQESYRLLVVDDEDITRSSLADILRLEGYRVDTAGGGERAIQMMSEHNYDLILLDLKMPGVDGLEVLQRMANDEPGSPSQPYPQPPPTVIMLTAHGSLESAIEALRHGAHDYLLKPSSPEQILKSIAQGLLARSNQIELKSRLLLLEKAKTHTQSSTSDTLSHHTSSLYRLSGESTYDPARREIKNKDEIIFLTPTEGKLIKVFLDQPGRVFTHRELVLQVQGYDTKDWEAPEVLRPLISRLRRKLSRLPGGISWITSVRGTGYVFDLNMNSENN